MNRTYTLNYSEMATATAALHDTLYHFIADYRAGNEDKDVIVPKIRRYWELMQKLGLNMCSDYVEKGVHELLEQ